jgi:FdhD protein
VSLGAMHVEWPAEYRFRMRHRPQAAKTTQVTEWDDGRRRSVLDELAVEEPLEIYVNGQPAGLTMRTPGDDFELAAGFLFTEGVVGRRDEIARISYGPGADGQVSGNRVEVALSTLRDVELTKLARVADATSSCGVCGRASIDSVRSRGLKPLLAEIAIDAAVLTNLPSALRESQRVFGRTGGLHAAGLFQVDGTLSGVCEDIGRHNAVDKVIGRALLQDQMPLSSAVLVVSGRGGFEIIQKAIAAEIPVVASVSAPSSLAVQLAREFNQTLIGFLRGRRFIVYSGEHRIQPSRASNL